jgi:hypothetical protein
MALYYGQENEDASKIWLQSMAEFCIELQSFIKAVPLDASMKDYAGEDFKMDEMKYKHLSKSCRSSLDACYMQVNRHCKQPRFCNLYQDVISDGSLFYAMCNKDYSLCTNLIVHLTMMPSFREFQKAAS